MTIKVKNLGTTKMPTIIKKGDWIDLYTKNENHILALNEYKLIPLGVAMALPPGFEAIMAPRSSTYKNYKVLQANSLGILDNSFCGNNDEWHFPALAIEATMIPKGIRLCQFRIQLSQKATFWQKLKWIFSSKIKIVEVNNLNNNDRGGFGSTGNK